MKTVYPISCVAKKHVSEVPAESPVLLALVPKGSSVGAPEYEPRRRVAYSVRQARAPEPAHDGWTVQRDLEQKEKGRSPGMASAGRTENVDELDSSWPHLQAPAVTSEEQCSGYRRKGCGESQRFCNSPLPPSAKQTCPQAKSQKRDRSRPSPWQNLQSGKEEAHGEECCEQRSSGYTSTRRSPRSAELTSSRGFDQPLTA